MFEEKSITPVPIYYKAMYKDGFTPAQILCAKRRQMQEQLREQEIDIEEYHLTITSEVKIK